MYSLQTLPGEISKFFIKNLVVNPADEIFSRRYVDMISDENSLQARANCLAEFNLAPTCKDFYTEVNTIYRGVNDFRFHRLDAFNQFIAVR